MKRSCKIIIRSVGEDGRKFRPSDWIERISTTMATFGTDNRLHYSNLAQPKIIDGEKCLVVDQALEDENPSAYRYIISFIKSNRLQVIEICDEDTPEIKAG